MKKVAIGIAAVLVILVVLFVSGYNGIVKAQTLEEEQNANIKAPKSWGFFRIC